MSLGFRGMKTRFAKNMRGWQTGTLEVGDVQVEMDPHARADFNVKSTSLTILTSDAQENLSKKEAEIHGESVFWESEDLRMPIYSRYSSSVVFELGAGGTIKSLIGKGGPKAIAVLWLQDLTDDVEQSVKLPIFIGKDLENLRQNAINDQTAKHHDFELAGWMTVVLKLSSGLDLDQ
jgi:hypothetical protein